MSRLNNQSSARVGLALCFPALLPVLLLGAHLVFEVWAALGTFGPAHLLTWEWKPDAQRYGLLPLISSTLAASIWAMVLWFPIGLAAACWLGILARGRLRLGFETVLGVLASLPTTVAALIVTGSVMRFTGYSLASAAAVLALLSLPLFVASAAGAIRQATELRLAAEALGLPGGAVCRLIVRKAWRGVLGAALLAFSRSAGESLAVKLVADNTPTFSWWLGGSAKTLGSTLALDYGGASGEHAAMLAGVQLTLAGIAIALSLIVRKMEARP